MDRTLVDSAYLELNGLFVHSARRMVCGKKSNREGDVVGYVFGTRRYSAVRSLEDYCLIIIGIYIIMYVCIVMKPS